MQKGAENGALDVTGSYVPLEGAPAHRFNANGPSGRRSGRSQLNTTIEGIGGQRSDSR